MSKLLESLKSIVGWPYTVLAGMSVTQKYFNRKAVTIHYPQQKRKVYDAWRGILAMAVDEKGAPKCISCGLCERICPTKSITLKTEQPEGSKKKLLVGFRGRPPDLHLLRDVRGDLSGGCHLPDRGI